jgi:hypothetical protein
MHSLGSGSTLQYFARMHSLARPLRSLTQKSQKSFKSKVFQVKSLSSQKSFKSKVFQVKSLSSQKSFKSKVFQVESLSSQKSFKSKVFQVKSLSSRKSFKSRWRETPSRARYYIVSDDFRKIKQGQLPINHNPTHTRRQADFLDQNRVDDALSQLAYMRDDTDGFIFSLQSGQRVHSDIECFLV